MIVDGMELGAGTHVYDATAPGGDQMPFVGLAIVHGDDTVTKMYFTLDDAENTAAELKTWAAIIRNGKPRNIAKPSNSKI